MITLKNVGIRFSPTEALLENVNLSMRRGETFVIIGPSGLGKSTLVKNIAGLVEPFEGETLIEGQNIYTAPKAQRAQLMKKMGMLFQKNALFDSFTCGENLAFPLREATSQTPAAISEIARRYLDYVGLLHAEHLHPDEISGGMQKRIGIARALVLNPEIILYDDPTAGLDPITSRMIIDLILRLKKEFASTVVAITNDMNRAYQMADRIGIIMDHTLVITGTVDETKHHPDPRVQQFIRGLKSDQGVA